MERRDKNGAFDALNAYLTKTTLLEQVRGVLDWDQETCMPSAAHDQRGEQNGALTEIVHARWTAGELGDLLDAVDVAHLDTRQLAAVRVAKTERERALRVPVEVAAEIARVTPESIAVWTRAREESDYEPFRPMLERMVRLKRHVAEAIADDNRRYDALLSEYEPGTTSLEVSRMFLRLRDGLADLLGRVRDTGRCTPDFTGDFPKPKQLDLAHEIAVRFGYDTTRGRMDQSVHPFTAGSHNDVRITTRMDEGDPLDCLYSTIHEVGHALYEQGVDRDLGSSILGSGTSMGVHESQSRIMENQIGRSRAFCSYLFESMCNRFGTSWISDANELYRAVNAVKQGFIRTSADEVQYNLHIMLRFDLERALIDGDLDASDLEAAWNDRFSADFGFEVDTARNGVLQDIHWAFGLFGYFPTYAIGNIYAAEIMARVEQDIPDLDNQVSQGDVSALLVWLRENVHRHGKIYLPNELMRRVIGHEPSELPLMEYLNKKFGELYGC